MKKSTVVWLCVGVAGLGLTLSCFGVIGLIAWSSSKPSPKRDEPTTSTLAKPLEPSIKVAAEELAADYESNELAANHKYVGQCVEITGKLRSVSSDHKGRFILLEAPRKGPVIAISCYFEPLAADLEKLSKGQPVTVRGICLGLNFSHVEFDRCTIR